MTRFWLTPVTSDEQKSVEDHIRQLVYTDHLYAFDDRTPGREDTQPGDEICFYATGNGVIAHAVIVSVPALGSHPSVRDPEHHPWLFRLDSVNFYPGSRVVLDAELRAELDAFSRRDPGKNCGWFVVQKREVTEADFDRLVRRQVHSGPE